MAFRKKSPKLLNAIFNLFHTGRSPDQLSNLEKGLQQCTGRCDLRQKAARSVHDVITKILLEADWYGGNAWKMLVSRCFSQMASFVEDVHSGTLEEIASSLLNQRRTEASSGTRVALETRMTSTSKEGVSKNRHPTLQSGNTAYLAMAEFLVLDPELALRMCWQWYDATRVSAVLDFAKACLEFNLPRFSPPLISLTELPHTVCEELDAFFDRTLSEGRSLDKKQDKVVYQQSLNIPYSFFGYASPALSVDDRASFLSTQCAAKKLYITLVRLSAMHAPHSLLSSFSAVVLPNPSFSPEDRDALQKENKMRAMMTQGQAVLEKAVWQCIPEEERPVIDQHVATLSAGSSISKMTEFLGALPPPEQGECSCVHPCQMFLSS